jgi:thiol-disulfide isomerase/thioredoxin
MEDKLNLRWNDLGSPTMNSEEYLEKYFEKIATIYNTYEPKPYILEQITTILNERKERLKIAALGADWCPDCNRNIPRMIKIVKAIKSKYIDFRILYGVIVNALHKPGEPLWHKTRSPPEAIDPRFDLQKIPTFYFFNKHNNFIGMIQENPKKTIEEDLLEILKSIT